MHAGHKVPQEYYMLKNCNWWYKYMTETLCNGLGPKSGHKSLVPHFPPLSSIAKHLITEEQAKRIEYDFK